MCLSVLEIEPDAEWPVRLLSFREEFLDREWDRAGEWWDDHPGVVGGRDRRAGGTWLALAPAARRLAAIHTSFTERVPADRRRTRGVLPVAAAAGHGWEHDDLGCFDDFTLMVVDDASATWYAYRDAELTTQTIAPGRHLGSVAGLGPDTPRARQRHWTHVVESAGLPKLDASGSPAHDWEPWLERTGAAALDPTDELALLIRREPRGKVFGTSSVSFVAFPATGPAVLHTLPDPFDPTAWTPATSTTRRT